MAKFSLPSAPSLSVMAIDKFLGVDFTNSPASVMIEMSPNCKNMIRDVPGKVRKCMGYSTDATYADKINGCHKLQGDTDRLIHTGTKIYKGEAVLYTSANNERSKSWQFGNKLYILDGLKLLVYDGTTITPADSNAYIPTLTIAKSPKGGGTEYEALNLLQPGFTEKFAGTKTDTEYQLSFGNLDSTPVEVKVMDSNGDMVEKILTTDYTVDRINGKITFVTAPGESPVPGEDNVFITAYRTVSGYADRINKCTFGIMYGVGGAADRLFISGNPDYLNQDWYSAQNDPTYFPDTAYSQLGSPNSAIMGYSIISNYLAAHKDENETHQSIILRNGELIEDKNGELIEDKPSFRIVNTLQGAGAIAKDTFAYLATEPLFLTRLGVYAITAQDVTGEKYAQNRSFYINGKLLTETDLEKSFAVVYKDMYWLFLNGVAYILDGLQPLPTVDQMPYATRQYACFYRTNIPASCAWVEDGVLHFGTSDGKVNKFYTSKNTLTSYSDNGEPIEAIWETPDIDGKLFYKNKTFRQMAIRLQAAAATSVSYFCMRNGLWDLVRNDEMSARCFSFSNMTFSKLTFVCNNTQKIITSKVRIKKVDKARFRYINNKKDEPFGIQDIAFEFVETGNYKGG